MKPLWRIIVGYVGIILSLNCSIFNLITSIKYVNPRNILIGILFNIIFVIDLINAYKYSDLSKNIILNMTPIMVLFVIVAESSLWLWESDNFDRQILSITLVSIISVLLLVLIANRLFNYFKSKKA